MNARGICSEASVASAASKPLDDERIAARHARLFNACEWIPSADGGDRRRCAPNLRTDQKDRLR